MSLDKKQSMPRVQLDDSELERVNGGTHPTVAVATGAILTATIEVCGQDSVLGTGTCGVGTRGCC